jgi:LacI family transcriptional regulator, repressor for deo operon, udp, cdd, tsx, nupC, and nupG
MAKIQDVAREAGVSMATVTRAFKEPNRISVETRERVLAVAARLGYSPPYMRQTRITSSRAPSGAPVVCFLYLASVPWDTLTTNPFYGPVFAGAQAEARRLGVILRAHSSNRFSFAGELPKLLKEGRIDGVLLIGAIDVPLQASLARQFKEIILLDSRDTTGFCESIVSDNFQGTYTATRYLLELQHRHFVFVTDDSQASSFKERQYGFSCALLDMGLPVPRPIVINSLMVYEDRVRFLADTLNEIRSTVSGIVVANDHYATETVEACRRLGLKVPEDMSVIGFDDVELAANCVPPLTTIRVDTALMGRLGVERLYWHLNAPNSVRETEPPTRPPIVHEVPVALIVRESCRTNFPG